MITFDEPGTTRDAVHVPFERDGRRFVLIDTAGVRRKARVEEGLEKWSVVKTLQARRGRPRRDRRRRRARNRRRAGRDAVRHSSPIAGARSSSRSTSGTTSAPERREDPRRARPAAALPRFAPVHYISALHGSGVGELMDAVRAAFAAAMREMPTPDLTRVLEAAIRQHQPPLVRGRRIRLRYAHQGGRNPPVIVIHGSPGGRTPEDYRRYLENSFREAFRLKGTPVRVDFRSEDESVRGPARQADAAPAAHPASATHGAREAESACRRKGPAPAASRARGGLDVRPGAALGRVAQHGAVRRRASRSRSHVRASRCGLVAWSVCRAACKRPRAERKAVTDRRRAARLAACVARWRSAATRDAGEAAPSSAAHAQQPFDAARLLSRRMAASARTCSSSSRCMRSRSGLGRMKRDPADGLASAITSPRRRSSPDGRRRKPRRRRADGLAPRGGDPDRELGAAEGVGARTSATKSAIVKSTSWPMPVTTGRSGMRQSRARAARH